MKRNSGNVLWFILLAVFLLGALSAVLMRGAQNTEETGDVEKTSITASEILNFTSGLKQSVDLLRSRGCSESDFNLGTGYPNANSPPDGSCHIFDIRGAGFKSITPKDSWFSEDWTQATVTAANAGAGSNYKKWFFPKTTCVRDIGTGGANCHTDPDTVRELIVILAFIKKDVCLAINRILGIPSVSGEPPIDTSTTIHTSWSKYNGTFSGTSAKIDVTGQPGVPALCAKKSPASTGVPNNTYYFYQVLIPR